MHICFIRLQQWSVYFDLHNSTFPQLVVDRDDSARAQDFQVRPPRKLYLVVTTDRAIRQGPQFTSRDCFDSRSAHFLCQREFSFALFILIQGVLKVIKYWYKTHLKEDFSPRHTSLHIRVILFFRLPENQQNKEKDVNRNNHDPSLNIETFPFKSGGSPSRCHHVDCGVLLFGDCNGDANEDLALWAMFLSFDP